MFLVLVSVLTSSLIVQAGETAWERDLRAIQAKCEPAANSQMQEKLKSLEILALRSKYPMALTPRQLTVAGEVFKYLAGKACTEEMATELFETPERNRPLIIEIKSEHGRGNSRLVPMIARLANRQVSPLHFHLPMEKIDLRYFGRLIHSIRKHLNNGESIVLDEFAAFYRKNHDYGPFLRAILEDVESKALVFLINDTPDDLNYEPIDRSRIDFSTSGPDHCAKELTNPKLAN